MTTSMIAKPIIPQTSIRFVGEKTVNVPPSAGDTVAVMFLHDWGPLGAELNKPSILAQFSEFTDVYGDSDTDARTAVAQAFVGQGTPGAGGAGGVMPYRMGASAARATHVITNTTPATAITVTAKWTGTRGNRYSYVIDVDPVNGSNQRFRLKFDGAVIETYTYLATTPSVLVAAINSRNEGNITATLQIDGVALTVTSGTSLAGGLDGNALAMSDYTTAVTALEFQPFTKLVGANLTDGATQAALLAWVQGQSDANRPIIFVAGGLPGESLTTAAARSTALADPHVVNFGIGTYHDDLLNKDLSTGQLAARIAGVLCARGEGSALTGAELGGLHVVGTTGPDTPTAQAAIQQGVTCLIRTDSPDADVRIAKGVTTFTSTSDANRPLNIFSEPRFIVIMDNFVRAMRLWGDQNVVGSKPVNQDTRDGVTAQGAKLIGELLRRGLILTVAGGATEDPFFSCPVTTDDTVPFNFGWQFAQTANYLLGQGSVK